MTTLTLAPGQGNETVLTGDDILADDFAKTHTGVSDFEFRIPDSGDNYREFRFDEFYLEDGSDFLFRGRIEQVEWTKSRNETRLSGHGIGYRLETTNQTLSVKNQLAHNAISDFWNGTDFTATVTTPSVDNTITGDTAQEADTNAEFSNIVGIADDVPLAVQNTNIELLQSADPEDVLDDNTSSNNLGLTNGDEYNDGQAGILDAAGAFAEFEFTFPYDIPIENVGIQIRDETNGSSEISYQWNGNEFDRNGADSVPLDWHDIGNSFYGGGGTGTFAEEVNSGIQAGETNTLRIEVLSASSYNADVVAVYDNRYNYDFPNPDAATNAGGILDGPQEYPDQEELEFNLASTSWNVTDATLTTSWDDTSNSQRIQLRLTDQTWFPNDGSEDNTTSVTTNFGSEVGSAIQGRARFSRYGSGGGSIPATGFNGQQLQNWEITYDGNDIAVISDETFEGTQFEVAQDLHERGDMRFTILHKKNSLEVESYKQGDVTKTLPEFIEKDRTTRTDISEFANVVTVRGQTVDGTRLSQTESDSASIAEVGQQEFDVINPSLTSQVAVGVEARRVLKAKLREINDKGDLVTNAIDTPPGFDYNNPFGEGTIPLEEISYQEGSNRLESTMVFDYRTGEELASDIGNLRRDSRNTRRGF